MIPQLRFRQQKLASHATLPLNCTHTKRRGEKKVQKKIVTLIGNIHEISPFPISLVLIFPLIWIFPFHQTISICFIYSETFLLGHKKRKSSPKCCVCVCMLLSLSLLYGFGRSLIFKWVGDVSMRRCLCLRFTADFWEGIRTRSGCFCCFANCVGMIERQDCV